MSMNPSYYTIVGYDLTGNKGERYNSWIWEPEGEDYVDYQSVGNVQLFNDPCSGCHLLLGYIFAANDEFSSSKYALLFDKVEEVKPLVDDKLLHLIEIGVISEVAKDSDFKIISFAEWR